MSWYEFVVMLIVLAFWLMLVGLVLRGWRNRGRRQEEAVGTLPAPPAEPGEPTIGPHTGLYLGATMAPSWQNRIAVGDVGDRATCTYARYPGGILIERNGASSVWIPEESISAVRPENGLAGKVMSRDGVLVIRWTLPSGLEIDTGIRGDDKDVYPQWSEAYEKVTDATREKLAQEDAAGSTTNGKKRKKS
ncbi:transporter [Gordonia sp. VNK21]|uniref:PH-like domain-containing protein n=1 Tax=Gordonia sp. VNK21 TaxID=3382483 RepID=UPI0038D50B5F